VRIPLITYGCSPAQAKARIGEAVKAGVSLAVASSKLIALEKLDFAKKKAELENQGIRYRRRLSSFAYSRMVTRLMARAFDQGIKVKPVDPAYPSRIGKHKFAQQYGMSNHQAAALTIGRRALYLSERPNRQDPNALPLPGPWDRIEFCPMLSTAGSEILPLSAGGIPARESSTTLFGRRA
jgi:transposase, IS605 OrfB family, central region